MAGEDCAWVNGIRWMPTSADVTIDIGNGKSVVVPVDWIDSYADIVSVAGGDKAAALQRTAAIHPSGSLRSKSHCHNNHSKSRI